MKCPLCGSVSLMVIYTRDAPNDEIRRRRKCKSCGIYFTTYEMTVEAKTALKQAAKGNNGKHKVVHQDHH